jgi:hypothetical protein
VSHTRRAAFFAAALIACACLPSMAAEPATSPADVTLQTFDMPALDASSVKLTPSVNYVLPALHVQNELDLAQVFGAIAVDAMGTAHAAPSAGAPTLGSPTVLIFVTPHAMTADRSASRSLLLSPSETKIAPRAIERRPKYVST